MQKSSLKKQGKFLIGTQDLVDDFFPNDKNIVAYWSTFFIKINLSDQIMLQ
jgi:hypothetical protein